jgi:hypothetical protein
MSTRSAIIELGAALSSARQRLAEVRQSTRDHPTDRETVVVDLVQDACDDLDGWLLSATTEIETGIQAATLRRPAHVAEQLAAVSVATERAVATYVTGIGGVDSIARLRDLAADQGGAWQEWAWTVLAGLDPVWTSLMAVRAHLDRSWLELVEHLLGDPVEVRTSPTSRVHQVNDILTGGQ